MTRRLAVCAALMLAACSRQPASPEIAAAVAAFDQQLAQVEQWRAQRSGHDAATRLEREKDFRGRTLDDDLDRWVLSADTRREVKRLRDRATEANYLGDAQQLLTQAHHRLDAEIARGNQVWAWWNSHPPAPYWRRYWHDLYAANGVTEEGPDSMLVAIEARMKRSLDVGDFETAAKAAEELNAVFPEATSRATSRLFKSLEARNDFTPRKTPCPHDRVRPSGEKAQLVRGDSVDSFYPEEAIKRAESGAVVMRARIDAAGCATSVLVQVRSGVPSLDAAALRWFETASFSPASSHGVPIESTLAWKVRFELRESGH